jgi:two-component system, OmpR family, sensor kinase
MIRRLWPRSIRSRLLATTVLSVGASLVVLVLAFNLLFARRLDANATDQARARAQAEMEVLTVNHGVVEHAPGEIKPHAGDTVWVFANGETIDEPSGRSSLDGPASRLGARSSGTMDVGDVRLAVVPITDHHEQVGSVVAAVSVEPYEQAQQEALIASVALSLIVLAIVTVIARWILAHALRPVSAMTTSARAWSDRDLDQRFGFGEPYDELTELAATLDQLLDRNAAALRREQRLTAEISHELRTPLARIAAEAELALRRTRTPEEYRAALELVDQNARAMTRIIDTLLNAARAGTGSAQDASRAREAAERAAGAAADTARANGVELAIDSDCDGAMVAADIELTTQILQPIVDNACRHGRSRAVIGIARDDRAVVFRVEDDGEGVTAEESQNIFLPGVRGADTADAVGAGLGLALARRLAESVGGTVEASPGPGGAFTVRIPARP